MMRNTKTRSTVNYRYNLGDVLVRESTYSNYVHPQIKDVNVKVKRLCNVKYFKPGDTITYNIIVTNEGTFTADTVKINDRLEYQTIVEGTIKVTAFSEQDFTYTTLDDGVEFVLNNLKPYKTVYITYQTAVNELVDSDYKISSSSEVIVDEEELMYSNPIDLEQKYAKIICEEETVEIIYPNKSYNYLITVENVGNEDADDVDLLTQIPDDYELEKIMIDEEECEYFAIDDNMLKYNVGNLEAKATKLITISGVIKKK